MNGEHQIVGGRCVLCGGTDYQEKDATLLGSCPGRIPRQRTKSQVLQSRNGVGGSCCDKYADNMACDCLEEAVDDKTIDLQTITNQIKLGQSCHNPLFPEQFLETVLRAREFMITRHGRCGPFLLTVGGDVARHLEKPYFRKIFPERTLRQRLLEVEGITRIEVVSDREAGFSLTLERN